MGSRRLLTSDCRAKVAATGLPVPVNLPFLGITSPDYLDRFKRIWSANSRRTPMVPLEPPSPADSISPRYSRFSRRPESRFGHRPILAAHLASAPKPLRPDRPLSRYRVRA